MTMIFHLTSEEPQYVRVFTCVQGFAAYKAKHVLKDDKEVLVVIIVLYKGDKSKLYRLRPCLKSCSLFQVVLFQCNS